MNPYLPDPETNPSSGRLLAATISISLILAALFALQFG